MSKFTWFVEEISESSAAQTCDVGVYWGPLLFVLGRGEEKTEKGERVHSYIQNKMERGVEILEPAILPLISSEWWEESYQLSGVWAK